MGILGLMVVVWLAQGHKSDTWPAAAWALFAGMIFAGLLVCWVAMAGSDKPIRGWVSSAGTHEGEIIVAVLAAPVYWLGKRFGKSQRK